VAHLVGVKLKCAHLVMTGTSDGLDLKGVINE
jgi:hypothetical protein